MVETSTEPLLDESESNHGGEVAPLKDDGDLRMADGEEEEESGWLVAELKKQFWLAGPMVCVVWLQSSLQLITLVFVGRLGALAFTGASMALSVASVTGISILVGISSVLETLCGQEYGAKRYHLLGIQLQRAIVVLIVTSVPIAVVWANMEPLLLALGQDPLIAACAAQYARWMLPSLFAIAVLQPLMIFLQTQSAVLPMAFCTALTLCFHVLMNWLLIFKLEVGYRGSALAFGISEWLNVIFLAIYIKFSLTCKKTWAGFSTRAFQDMTTFLKLAVPSAVMMCLNGVVLMNIIPAGLGVAASTRVSNELGAGRATAAVKAAVVAFSVSLSEAVLLASISFATRHAWPGAFISESEVVNYVAQINMPFLFMLTILVASQEVLNGVTRGCGNQMFGAFINLGAYYVVGLPLAVILITYYDLKGRGLLIGLITAVAIQSLGLGAIAVFSNWNKQAQAALDRVYTDDLPTAKSTIHKVDLASPLLS